MDSEKNLQILLAILNKIIPPLIIVIALLIFYFFYNEDFLRKLMTFLVPLLFYVGGLLIFYYFRNWKKKKLINENGSQEIFIRINYFTFFWHDVLLFLTPCVIIILAYWVKGQIELMDIVASALAAIGLYLSELIYKQ